MSLFRIFAYMAITLFACVAWGTLGGITSSRQSEQSHEMYQESSALWGPAYTLQPPTLNLTWEETVETKKKVAKSDGSSEEDVTTYTQEVRHSDGTLDSQHVSGVIHHEPRRKGLIWLPFYSIDIDSAFRLTNPTDKTVDATLSWDPDLDSRSIENLSLVINGQSQPIEMSHTGKMVHHTRLEPGESLECELSFETKGSADFRYLPPSNTVQRDLRVDLTTDFLDIDFPTGTKSPLTKTKQGKGWTLVWEYETLMGVGDGFGMTVPVPMQIGEAVSRIAFAAPWALILFIAITLTFALMRQANFHPMHLLLIISAFFSFNLVLSYVSDWVTLPWGFLISALISVGLVISYCLPALGRDMTLKVIAPGQLIYLLGFALVSLLDGARGLGITLLGTLTLLAIMQLTKRVDWNNVFSKAPSVASGPVKSV